MLRLLTANPAWPVTSSLTGALVASLFFSGTGDGFVVLVAVSAALLLSVSLVGWRGYEAALAARRAPIAAGLLAIVALIASYQLSLSKDSSFAPSWVLGALPLTFLAVLALEVNARARLQRAVVCVVAILAAVSLVRYFAYGERAHLPLVDPNNYAALMYLAWIPFVHDRLVRGWRGESDVRARDLARESLPSFLLLAAVFATQSRAGATVVVVALGVWLVLALVRRLPLRGLLVHVGATVAAFILVWVASPAPIGAGTDTAESLGTGLAVRADLVESALKMFAEYPVAGVGAFCFNLMYGAYRSLAEQETAGLFVHNDYVQLLAEGGILLAIWPVYLAVTVALRVVRGVRSPLADVSFERLGAALALGAACAHAAINFVFYSLPLSIVIGILAGALFGAPAPQGPAAAPTDDPLRRWTCYASIAVGWIFFAHLLLDFMTVAVFQGQPGAPFARAVRERPDSQLRYARFAQTLNGQRGIPVLGEAMLLARRVDEASAHVAELERVMATFRRAIQVDPWNPLAYVAMADFARRHGDGLVQRDGETSDALLLNALALDPTYVPAIDRLIEIHVARGRLGDAYALLRNVVFPWIELLKRRDDAAATRYMTQMQTLAERVGDSEFLAALHKRREALANVQPVRHRTWFDGAQPSESGSAM